MNAPARVGDTLPATAPPPESTPARLLELAVQSNADPEKLRQLMDLQERWEAQNAKRAYFAALASFQRVCPHIPKTKAVRNRDGSERYRFAPLDDIVAAVRGPLMTCGFSYRFETTHNDDGSVRVACVVQHEGGHTERSEVVIPTFAGQGTNKAQDTGIAITYGRRYAFCDAFGITTGDEDTDGHGADDGDGDAVSDQQAADIECLISEVGADRLKFLKHCGVESVSDIKAKHFRKVVDLLEQKRKHAGAPS